LLLRVGLGAPTIGGSECGASHRLGQRTGVDDTGDTQRAPEGAAALRQRETSRIRMQVRSPTRPPAGRIRHEAELLSIGLDRDKPQQLGG
jgi:hypothetical protein